MRELLLKFLSLSLVLQWDSPLAHAQTEELLRLPLLTITADHYKGEYYYLGFEIENKKLKGLYFQDDFKLDGNGNRVKPNEAIVSYPISKMGTKQILVQARKKYNIVMMTYINSRLTIYYRQHALKDAWLSKNYLIQCDSNYSGCNVKDEQTSQTIRSVRGTSHKVWPLGTVGIEDILSQ